MLVNEAVEAGASRSAIKPENHRILGGVSLGDHKVVEELPPMVFIYMIRWERSVESWQVSDASILGGRRGQVEATAEEHQPQLESTSARGRIGHALLQGDRSIDRPPLRSVRTGKASDPELQKGLVGPATDDGLVDPYGAAVH
ncbi:hypothetical protein BHE74_00046135 [Ensete ventricosum]|nr:hypothetical protein BHE74_00046135 [Ensete ventricosum]